MTSKSNRWLHGLALGGLMFAAGLAFTPSAAEARIFVNVGVPLPFIAPPPVVYAPPVVYPPVYAAPAPVYGHVVYGHTYYGHPYYGHPGGWHHHHRDWR